MKITNVSDKICHPQIILFRLKNKMPIIKAPSERGQKHSSQAINNWYSKITAKLLNQGYQYHKLWKTFSRF